MTDTVNNYRLREGLLHAAEMAKYDNQILNGLPRGERILGYGTDHLGRACFIVQAKGTRLGLTSVAGRPHAHEREIFRRQRQAFNVAHNRINRAYGTAGRVYDTGQGVSRRGRIVAYDA